MTAELVGDPCFKCATRADLGCRHQEAHGALPPGLRRMKLKADGRTERAWSPGYNFGGAKTEMLQRAIQRLRTVYR